MQHSLGHEQLRQLRQLAAEHAPVPETLIGPDGIVLSVNRALCDLLRSESSQLVGNHYADVTHPDDRARHERLFQEAVAGVRDGYRLTKRCQRADGSLLQGDFAVNVLRDEAGRVRCLIGQLIDVTPQRAHEQHLREALVQDRSVLSAQPILPLAPEGGAAVTALAGVHLDLRFVDEFHVAETKKPYRIR